MIGVIGGTGLYQMEGLQEVRTQSVETPFGASSAEVVIGKLDGQPVAFLPRHGKSHGLLPSEINYRANLWALKAVGVRRVFSVSAVGSLVQAIEPGHLAVPSQYLDFTKGKRVSSFFGEGLVGHVSTAEPSCPDLSAVIDQTARAQDVPLHSRKTYICVEGPRLGTQAESHWLRNSGGHLVGMTNVPEAFLAREAQLCYCTIAVVTDYDSWLDGPAQHASATRVLELYRKNLVRVQNLLRAAVRRLGSENHASPCHCRSALQCAVVTPENSMSDGQRAYLQFLRE